MQASVHLKHESPLPLENYLSFSSVSRPSWPPRIEGVPPSNRGQDARDTLGLTPFYVPLLLFSTFSWERPSALVRLLFGAGMAQSIAFEAATW
jgi:hypothetical protein